MIFLAPKILRKFSLSLFDEIHKSNFSKIFFAKFIINFHLLKDFSVILAFINSKGIFFSLICKIKFGQISESIKIDKFGFQCSKNLFVKIGTSNGKNW